MALREAENFMRFYTGMRKLSTEYIIKNAYTVHSKAESFSPCKDFKITFTTMRSRLQRGFRS